MTAGPSVRDPNKTRHATEGRGGTTPRRMPVPRFPNYPESTPSSSAKFPDVGPRIRDGRSPRLRRLDLVLELQVQRELHGRLHHRGVDDAVEPAGVQAVIEERPALAGRLH